MGTKQRMARIDLSDTGALMMSQRNKQTWLGSTGSWMVRC
jgi:hypothetical protein